MDIEGTFDYGNSYIKKQYEQNENYKIDKIGNGNICYIFFSSNGLVAPFTEQGFIETIVQKDRYEWKHVANSKEILAKAGKIIYVRDVYQQFYVWGINRKINSIDKICSLLEELKEGMRVVTCGTSGGGYMAVIAGIYLGAERIFSFGGQWALGDQERSLYFLEKYKEDKERNKYSDITGLLNNNKIPIMYFYSALNPGDVKQAEILLACENRKQVWCFPMKSDIHGYLLFNSCYKSLLTCEMTSLICLCDKFMKKKKMISLRWVCLFLLRFPEAIWEVLKDIIGKQKL